jgi:amino acid permease
MMSSLLGFSGMMFESMSGSGVSESWKEFTVTNFPRFVGSICLCLGGVTMMLPIRSELKQPESFRRVFRTSFFTTATVFILFGIVANLAFGNISFLYQIRSWHPKSTIRPYPRDRILLYFRIRINICGNGAAKLPNVSS